MYIQDSEHRTITRKSDPCRQVGDIASGHTGAVYLHVPCFSASVSSANVEVRFSIEIYKITYQD